PDDSPLTVCLYLPLAGEPLPGDMARQLTQRGIRVLAPVTRLGAPLDWGVYTGYDGVPARGAFGIAEPTGPRLGPEAIRWAHAILVPALGLDVRGTRLGRG